MVATAKTAASNVLFRSKNFLRTIRWAILIGVHLERNNEAGAQDHEPWDACFKCAVPCQGAKFTQCHNLRPSSQFLIAPAPTEPAPFVIIKCKRSHSGAGICKSAGMPSSSQNCVNRRRPAL